jgi:hypothetical protein
MEFRLYPTPQKVSSLWVSFSTVESAVEAMYDIMKKEYGSGLASFLSGSWVQSLYSSRHWQEGLHFLQALQDTSLVGMSFRGTSGKVAFEHRACARIFQKHGGVVLPKQIVAILDGHEQNVTGWQQCNSARLCGSLGSKPDSGGMLVNAAGFDSLDKLIEHIQRAMKAYRKICRKYPEFLNNPKPNIKLYTSCGQLYLPLGGHSNACGEIIFVLDVNRQFLPIIGEILTELEAMVKEVGIAPIGLGRDKRTWTECPAHFKMAKLIKQVVDPKGILSPGVGFPLSE